MIHILDLPIITNVSKDMHGSQTNKKIKEASCRYIELYHECKTVCINAHVFFINTQKDRACLKTMSALSHFCLPEARSREERTDKEFVVIST